MPKKRTNDLSDLCEKILRLARRRDAISVDEVRILLSSIIALFRAIMTGAGHNRRDVNRIVTKFRDAGRRSPPWRPTSSVVPGLPQDGADGNRQNRWLFEESHKFYASEKVAHLVEIKYYLQAISMTNAPAIPCDGFGDMWGWLVDHRVAPGEYLDPIQLVQIDLDKFVADRRYVESGHLVPLDRGGRHVVCNSFLMIIDSNRMQGNLTVDELLGLMNRIIQRHRALGHEIEDSDFSGQGIAG